MMKVLNSNGKDMIRKSEQLNDCSSLLIKADDPPLEALDPAILSCGLPAIMLSDLQQPVRLTTIRYSIDQLQALSNSSLCHRRPAAADDPRVASYAIWKTALQSKRSTQTTSSTVSFGGRGQKGDRDGRQHAKNNREAASASLRVRKNNELSSRNHYAIVKNYRNGAVGEFHPQEAIIEEEPEWVSAGPTSRLDTIELRGFDDDASVQTLSTSQTSLEKANGTNSTSSEKHISFYDDLHHYEHMHQPNKQSESINKGHDSGSSSGHEVDVDSVSKTSSPPPARSTPTKHIHLPFGSSDFNNNFSEGSKQQCGSKFSASGFEDFNIKLDSFIGNDNSAGQSRFSKWFRKSGANIGNFNPNANNGFDWRQQQQQQSSYGQSSDSHFGNFGSGGSYGSGNHLYVQQQDQQHRFRTSATGGANLNPFMEQQQQHNTETNNLKKLVDIMAQNRYQQQQQQFLMQLLSKNQQSEILRRILAKNTVDNITDSPVVAPAAPSAHPRTQLLQQQQFRVPTQRELQFHTQSIMQNALLRKKLQDQRKMLLEQNCYFPSQSATGTGGTQGGSNVSELNPTVQQFVRSVSPNIQRSLSVLSQTQTTVASMSSAASAGPTGIHGKMSPPFASCVGAENPGGRRITNVNAAGYYSSQQQQQHHQDLSLSLQQMLSLVNVPRR